MKVALYGAYADLSSRLYSVFRKQGLENGGTHVHCARSHKDLRNEDLVVLELLTDYVHSGKKSVLKNRLSRNTLIHRFLYKLFHDLGFSVLKVFGNLIQYTHIHILRIKTLI